MSAQQRSIWQIGTALVLLLLLLSCRMVYWQVVNERAFQPTALPTIAEGTEGHAGGRAPMGLIRQALDPAPRAPAAAQPSQGATVAPEATARPIPAIERAAIRQSTW